MSQKLELRKKRILLLSPYPKTERSETIIQGPILGWPFPILNALLQLIATRERAPSQQAYFPKIVTRRVEYVRDSSGRIIERYEEIEA